MKTAPLKPANLVQRFQQVFLRSFLRVGQIKEQELAAFVGLHRGNRLL